MKTALLLIACWLLILLPTEQGMRALLVMLLDADHERLGAAQMMGLGGMLLTLYLANLGVEVVLRRRFQLTGMLALLLSVIGFINLGRVELNLLFVLSSLPFLTLCVLILVRGLQAFGRHKG